MLCQTKIICIPNRLQQISRAIDWAKKKREKKREMKPLARCHLLISLHVAPHFHSSSVAVSFRVPWCTIYVYVYVSVCLAFLARFPHSSACSILLVQISVRIRWFLNIMLFRDVFFSSCHRMSWRWWWRCWWFALGRTRLSLLRRVTHHMYILHTI